MHELSVNLRHKGSKQSRANSLFCKILPASPFDPRFYPISPVLSDRNSNRIKILKSEIRKNDTVRSGRTVFTNACVVSKYPHAIIALLPASFEGVD